jgi:hypothetical protein
MLYTSKPLERIYADPSIFDSIKKEKAKDEVPQYREIMLPNGRIVTRREGENDIIERIYSTDMGDYLKEEYYPGKNIKQTGESSTK